MNYCFKCGAKILDNSQKFCISCGANLKEREEKHSDYKKEYRKKFTPKEGESYIDYLNRIDAPIADYTPPKEEMESYRSYDPHESIRENNITYPKSEEEAESTIPYKREIISEGMFGKPAVSIEGNFVYEGMYGRPKYYIDGDIIREGNQFGRPAYRIDGKYIREGMFGKPKYYIDGDLIRENNQFGKVIGRRKK